MPSDNVTLNAGTGGAVVRTLADASSNEWAASVVAYATTLSAGANVLQVVTSSFGLPVAQQGTWTVGVSGSVAVTGTFWQATQPVSGTFWQAEQPVSLAAAVAVTQSGTWSDTVTQATAANLNATVVGTGTFATQAAQSGTWAVTANAGTNLNTSLLALEAGGNLATIATNLPAQGQALAAASMPVVLTAAQLTTLTPLSTVAVTGTFWQATQPVSGTVTANAGSGTLAVSAASLPLPSGASTSAKQPALGTAGTASADVLTVQGIASMTALKVDGSGVTQPVSGTFWQATQPVSGTFWQATQPVSGTVAATQSGTWNVGTVTTVTTVSAVTAISNALPAGTNLLGQISASHETGTVYSGTTALTPKFAAITASSSGATTIVAAVTSKKIRVLKWSLSSNGAVNVKWQSHVSPTDKTGLHYMTQFASAGGAYCPVGHFETISGEALDINLSAAVAVGGELTYIEV